MGRKKNEKHLTLGDLTIENIEKRKRVEQARRGGRACLATYGKGYYQAMARRRHAKSQEPEQYC